MAPNKKAWIAEYTTGKHFESRIAHVHRNLFAFLNIVIGFLLLNFKNKLNNTKYISWLALIGIFMSLDILAKIYFSAPPIFALLGTISIIIAVVWLGFSFMQLKINNVSI